MRKSRKKLNRYKEVVVAAIGATAILASSFFIVKEYRIRKCVNETMLQLEQLLGPCPDELKVGVLKQVRTWCEQGQ